MADKEVSWWEILRTWHQNRFLAAVGFLLGTLLALGGLALLGWSEYNGIKRAQALEKGAASIVSVPSDKIDPAHEGKLVHLTGEAQTKETLKDPELGVEVVAIRLTRNVEMYQYKENKKTEKKNNKETTTISYDAVWSNAPINSKSFAEGKANANPTTMKYKADQWSAKDVKCGAFELAASLIDLIKDNKPLADDLAKAKLPEGVQYYKGAFYLASNPAKPEIGDLRIEFKVTLPATISVVAKQSGKGLVQFKDEGGQIEIVEMGSHDARSMFASAQSGLMILTWVLRVLAFVGVAFGLYLVGEPNAAGWSGIPLLGDILGLGGMAFGVTMALVLSLFVSAGIVLAYSPTGLSPGIVLLSVAGIIVVVARFLGASKQSQIEGGARLPSDVARAAGLIKRSGGQCYVYGEGADVTIGSITLEGKRFNDDDLAKLSVFTQLKDLSIASETGIKSLARLPALKCLESLSCQGDPGPDGMRAIGLLNGLKRLTMYGCKATDAGLAQLAGLTQLEELDLMDTQITDAGLAHVKNWPSLKRLRLSESAITGTGLEHCRDLKQLETLSIANSPLTDDGLASLKSLAGLKELALSGNQCTGAGLSHVQDFAKLEKLDFSETQLTDNNLVFLQKRVEALQKTFPNSAIYMNWIVFR